MESPLEERYASLEQAARDRLDAYRTAVSLEKDKEVTEKLMDRFLTAQDAYMAFAKVAVGNAGRYPRTGFRTIEAFQEFAYQALKEVAREGVVSFTVVDLNNLKGMNDLGELLGDHCLDRMAAIVKANVRSQDIIGSPSSRSDELYILSPRTGEAGVGILERRLNAALEDPANCFEPTLDNSGYVKVSAAVGRTTVTHQDLMGDGAVRELDFKANILPAYEMMRAEANANMRARKSEMYFADSTLKRGEKPRIYSEADLAELVK